MLLVSTIIGGLACAALYRRGWRLYPLLVVLFAVLSGVHFGVLPAPGPLIADDQLSAQQSRAVSALACRKRARDALSRTDLAGLAEAEAICPTDPGWSPAR
jgi:hypothetical protein